MATRSGSSGRRKGAKTPPGEAPEPGQSKAGKAAAPRRKASAPTPAPADGAAPRPVKSTSRRVKSPGGEPSAARAPAVKAARSKSGADSGEAGDEQAGEERPQGELEPEIVASEELGKPGAAVPEVLPPEPDLEAEDEAASDDAGEGEGGDPDLDERASRLPVPVGRDLSHADALQRYLAELSRHPLLSREEEHRLAVKFKETLDPALAYRLVTANLRLVVKIAMEYRRAAFSVLDLIQEGNVGLMQAVQKYDPFRGVKLSSYAAWWIRAYILRYLMDNWRMVKLGTTQAQRKLFFNLRKEQEKLLSQGFDAAPKLLAEKLDVSEQDVREMDQRLGNDEFSIDTPIGGQEESRTTYVDRLPEGRSGAEEQLGNEELRRVFKEQLEAFGKTLTDERDRFLFEHRISVPEGQEPLTLQQVGEKYGFTRERARQLEARLTGQLREYLRARLPDFAQLSVNQPDETGEKTP
jgi:RNA polymerase sigma-32 factor